ncbi:hypothetical protein BDQ17DRAFT_1323060 [Cyathus striatus]|nr:hypothetical protein BDQ17DRAFT_1323060 [Cyathus striatus]
MTDVPFTLPPHPPHLPSLAPVLTTVSHASSTFISTFLLVHLSAPALANLGGGSLASQTMLLGREYYQTSLTEPLLLLTPLSVHALSGLLRRLLSPAPKTNPSPVTGALSATGCTRRVWRGKMYNYWNVGLGKAEGGKVKLWGKKERKRALAGVFLGVVGPVISGWS